MGGYCRGSHAPWGAMAGCHLFPIRKPSVVILNEGAVVGCLLHSMGGVISRGEEPCRVCVCGGDAVGQSPSSSPSLLFPPCSSPARS